MAITFDSPVNPSGGIIFDSPIYVPGGNFIGAAVALQKLWQGLETGAAQDPNGITVNDTWVEPVSIELIQDVSVGVLQLQINGLFTYTPPPTFVGYVTFQYRLWELGAPSNIGTVTIAVDGDFAGQAVSGNLLTALQVSTPILGFSDTAAVTQFARLHYASGFTGSQNYPFIGNAVSTKKLRLAKSADKRLGQNALAQSIDYSAQLYAGTFVGGIGLPFVEPAQAIQPSLFTFPSDKTMGWQGAAISIKGQPQLHPTSAPFMASYPVIVNATFTLTSWSASVTFE